MKLTTANVSDAASAPSHPEHARWCKETLAEDDANWQRSIGVMPRSRAIEQHWTESLQRVERRKELQKHRYDEKPIEITKDRDDPARKAAEALGFMLVRNRKLLAEKQAAVAEANALLAVNPTFRAMTLRLRVILNRFRAGEPAFAKVGHEAAQLFMNHRLKRGDFRSVRTKKAADAILRRKCEDICDRSNSIIGLQDWRP